MNPLDLQRIVDGELSHELRAELLRSLGPDSSQWQELALLLLEDQELSKQIRSEPPLEPISLVRASLESDVLRTTHSKKSSLGYRLLAVCAIFSVGLGSGFWFKTIAPESASTSQASSLTKSELPTAIPSDSNRDRTEDRAGGSAVAQLVDSIPSSGASFDYVSPWRVRVENASDRAIEIPLVDAREIDPQLILANNALEIAKLNQQLKRRGYELEAKPTMYSGALEDGRRIMVPIHNVSLRPYGL
jgi:hypothetical protein